MKVEEIAALLLPHLVCQAKACQTITYGDLSKKVGIHHRPIPQALNTIRDRCLQKPCIPEINVLVVNARTRLPGAGFLVGGTSHLSPAEYRKMFESRKQSACAYMDWDQLTRRF